MTANKPDTLGADLVNPEDVAELERILRENVRVTVLVSNAGVVSVAPVLDANVEAMHSKTSLNVVAPTLGVCDVIETAGQERKPCPHQ